MLAGNLGALSRESKLVIGVVSGSEFINHTYLVLLPPILGLLAADFEVSLALLGVAIGVMGGATALFQLPFGYVSDHYDRTIGLGLSLGVGAVGTLVTALAPTFEVLVVGQALIGIGVAGHHPSHFPLLSEAVAEEYRARVFSIRGFAGALGFGAPPVVITGVLALPGTTWRHALALLGVVGLAYGLLAVGLFRRYVSPAVTVPDPTDRSTPAADASAVSRVVGEVRALAAMPAVLALAVLTLIMSTASNGFRTYLVVFFTDGYGLSLSAANLTLTAMFVVGAVVILFGGALADRLQPSTVLMGALAVVCLLIATFASMAVPAVVAMAVAVAVGAVQSGSGPARSKLVDRFAPGGGVGQSFAVMTVGMMLGGTIAPPVVGAVIEVAGLRVAFLVLAGIAATALVFTAAIVTRYDDRVHLPRPGGLLGD